MVLPKWLILFQCCRLFQESCMQALKWMFGAVVWFCMHCCVGACHSMMRIFLTYSRKSRYKTQPSSENPKVETCRFISNLTESHCMHACTYGQYMYVRCYGWNVLAFIPSWLSTCWSTVSDYVVAKNFRVVFTLCQAICRQEQGIWFHECYLWIPWTGWQFLKFGSIPGF